MCRMNHTQPGRTQAMLPLLLSLLFSPFALAESTTVSVLPLQTLDSAGRIASRHSAIVLGPEQALTRCSLVDGWAQIQLVTASGTRPAEVSARDEERDLCRLRTELRGLNAVSPNIAPLPLAQADIQALTHNSVGQRLHAVGTLPQVPAELQEVPLQVPLEPGAGGGAVLDTQGNLLGILAEPAFRGQEQAHMAPATWLNDLEARAQAQKPWSEAKLAALRYWAEDGTGQALERHCLEWLKRMPENRDAWYWLGLAQLRQGQGAAAETSLKKALELAPQDEQRWDAVLQALLLQNRTDAALAWAQAGVNQRPQSPGPWLALGQVQLSQSQNKAARAALRQALKLAPWSTRASLSLLALARVDKDETAEMELLQTLLGQNPAAAIAWREQAVTYLRQGQWQAAATALRQMETLAGESSDSLQLKAQLFRDQGQVSQAIALLKQAIALSPVPQENHWLRLAQGHADALVLTPALKIGRETVDFFPQSGQAKAELISLLIDNGQLEEAGKLLEAPGSATDATSNLLRGRLRERHGDFPGALAAYQEASQLSPDQADILYRLTRAAAWTGQKDLARNGYEKLLKIDPTLAETTWKDAMRILEAQP